MNGPIRSGGSFTTSPTGDVYTDEGSDSDDDSVQSTRKGSIPSDAEFTIQGDADRDLHADSNDPEMLTHAQNPVTVIRNHFLSKGGDLKNISNIEITGGLVESHGAIVTKMTHRPANKKSSPLYWSFILEWEVKFSYKDPQTGIIKQDTLCLKKEVFPSVKAPNNLQDAEKTYNSQLLASLGAGLYCNFVKDAISGDPKVEQYVDIFMRTGKISYNVFAEGKLVKGGKLKDRVVSHLQLVIPKGKSASEVQRELRLDVRLEELPTRIFNIYESAMAGDRTNRFREFTIDTGEADSSLDGGLARDIKARNQARMQRFYVENQDIDDAAELARKMGEPETAIGPIHYKEFLEERHEYLKKDYKSLVSDLSDPGRANKVLRNYSKGGVELTSEVKKIINPGNPVAKAVKHPLGGHPEQIVFAACGNAVRDAIDNDLLDGDQVRQLDILASCYQKICDKLETLEDELQANEEHILLLLDNNKVKDRKQGERIDAAREAREVQVAEARDTLHDLRLHLRVRNTDTDSGSDDDEDDEDDTVDLT